MNNKQKLTDLLCTVSENEKSIKELKFGSKVTFLFEGNEYNESEISKQKLTYQYSNKKEIDEEIKNPSPNLIKYTIGNPLEERYLRMYCEEKALNIPKDLPYLIWSNTMITIMSERNRGRNEEIGYIDLDNTKSFDNQTEEVYEKIFNFLSK